MKIIDNNGILRVEKEGDEVTVMRIFSNAHTIFVEDGFERIYERAFRGCEKLKTLHLPKSIRYLGSQIFQEKYSEVKIVYAGSSDDFKKIDLVREVYESGPYDRYPYYSDYGASYKEERFYAMYDSYDMWCEVLCKEDNVLLTYGSKKNH